MKCPVVNINEDLCNGCGICVEGCHEGALQLIDGKARIISETFCDGLGACIGECPLGAIEMEEKETEPYDEIAVMEKLVTKGENTIKAHLLHLKEHNEMEYFKQGIEYLKNHNIDIDIASLLHNGSCPGSKEMTFNTSENAGNNIAEDFSQLAQWPIQLHLVNSQASYFKNSDLILTADCCSYAYGNFHNRFLKNHSITITCPKLDKDTEIYIEKIKTMIDISNINTLSVIIMEVPCCEGLFRLAQQATVSAKRKVPIKKIIIGLKGNIVKEEWT